MCELALLGLWVLLVYSSFLNKKTAKSYTLFGGHTQTGRVAHHAGSVSAIEKA